MKTKHNLGFTLLELVIVMMILAIIMTLLFSIYNVMLSNINIGYAESGRHSDLMNALYTVEDAIKGSETASANTLQSITLTSQGLTVNFYLKPAETNFTLWIAKVEQDNSSEQPLCEGIVSPDTVFQVYDNEVWLTLNAQTITNNSIKYPISFEVTSRVLLRNGVSSR